MKTFKRTLLYLISFTLFSSCEKKKEPIFRAFTEGFLDWYNLNLYEDNNFELHIPSIDFNGNYKINGDTIFLNYKLEKLDTIRKPIAYIINANKKKIYELEKHNGKLEVAEFQVNWMDIDFNKLKFKNKINKVINQNEIEEKVINLISKTKIVNDISKKIDSLSNGERHISISATLDDKKKNIYFVQVGEMNDFKLVTYYNFYVEANKMEILNPNGRIEGQ
jgi:hypothetical protein